MSYPITLKQPALRKVGFSLLLAVFAAPAVYAHLQITRATIDYRGSLALLDRAFDLLLAVSIITLAYCIGSSISRALKLKFVGHAEEVAYSVMLGTGSLALCVFGLGIVGWLRPLPVAMLIILLLGITYREISSLSGLLNELFRELIANWTRLIAVSLIGLASLLLILRAAIPPYSPDEAIYHLPVTQVFVEHGQLFPVLDNFSGNLPFLVHMIYAVCLMAKADIAAKLFSVLLGLISALGLYGFCARFLSRRIGMIALLGFFAAGMVIEIAVTSRVDVTLAGMLFLTTSAMITYLATANRGWLIASALLAGFSMGIKYTAGLWLLMLGVLFCVECWRRGDSFSHIIKNGFAFILIALAVTSPWLIKNAVWFHNPIYPFFTGEVARFENGRPLYFTAEDQERIDVHFNRARETDPQIVAQIEQILAKYASRRPERHPLRIWEYLTASARYNIADPGLTPNYLFAFLPFLILAKKQRWIVWLLGISAGFFLLTVQASWIDRYLLPLYPPLTIISAYALNSASERIGDRFQLGKWLPLTIVGIALGVVLYKSSHEYIIKNGPAFLTGGTSRREFLMSSRGDYRALDFINRLSPPDAKVLMIGAQMNYGIEHPHISDAGWNSVVWRRLLSRCTSLEEVHLALKQQGVRYVMYYPNLFGFVAYIGNKGSGPSGDTVPGVRAAESEEPDYQIQLQNWVTFEVYSHRYLERIYGNDSRFGLKIFRLKQN